MTIIKVLVADDHKVVRNGIKMLLQHEKDIEIVGEAENGEETILKVKELLPDVLIIDITMPILSGIETTAIITSEFPATKVVIFSMFEEEAYIIQAIEAGAVGYLAKNAEDSDIKQAIRFVAKGNMYFTNSVSEILAKSLLSQSKKTEDESQSLSRRELEILRYIVNGSNKKERASALCLSIRKHDTHVYKIRKKLKLK